VCIGGACIDRKYSCIEPALPGTSNPARAVRSFGGVARNVAENLARFGVPVSLLTVAGNDENGRALVQHARDCGIDTSLVDFDADAPTSEYAALVNPNGDLLFGVADMRAIESLSASHVDRHWASIERASWLFLDCNVSADVLASCIERCRTARVRLAIDAVSEVKVRRLPARLDGVSLLFLNEGEAVSYVGAAPANASRVRQRGAAAVVMTRGAAGIVLAADTEIEIAAASARCIDPTGAGDALIAAALHRMLQGDDLSQAVRAGVIAAARTVESPESVRPDLLKWLVS
jgi:pseudouridine kinase